MDSSIDALYQIVPVSAAQLKLRKLIRKKPQTTGWANVSLHKTGYWLRWKIYALFIQWCEEQTNEKPVKKNVNINKKNILYYRKKRPNNLLFFSKHSFLFVPKPGKTSVRTFKKSWMTERSYRKSHIVLCVCSKFLLIGKKNPLLLKRCVT